MVLYPTLWGNRQKGGLPCGLIPAILILWLSLFAAQALAQTQDLTPAFGEGEVLGYVQESFMDSLTGIVASRQNQDTLWATGNAMGPYVFLMQKGGGYLRTYGLVGATNTDWQDIARGPGDDNSSHLFVLDNPAPGGATSNTLHVYRFAEPAVPQNADALYAELEVADWDRIDLTFPTDQAYRAEALMVDPTTGDIFVVAQDGNQSRIFMASYGQYAGDMAAPLTLIHTIDILATGGDIMSGSLGENSQVLLQGGYEMVIRSQDMAYVWALPIGGLWQAEMGGLTAYPVNLVWEADGRSICYSADSMALYTTSMGQMEPIYVYDREFDTASGRDPLVFTVDDDYDEDDPENLQYMTIQGAIDAATVNGDTIIVEEGTYFENLLFRGVDVRLVSRYVYDQGILDTDVADLTYESVPLEERSNYVIDGSLGRPGYPDSNPVVTFTGLETSNMVIAGFTVQNGMAVLGGGFYAPFMGFGNRGLDEPPDTGCRAVLEFNSIVNNEAQGATYTYGMGGAAVFTNGPFRFNYVANNRAEYAGGALYGTQGNISTNTFTGNYAEEYGGAMAWCAPLLIEDNIISNNEAGSGGAMFNCIGEVVVFILGVNNIYNGDVFQYAANVTISGNTISNNRANRGTTSRGELRWGSPAMNHHYAGGFGGAMATSEETRLLGYSVGAGFNDHYFVPYVNNGAGSYDCLIIDNHITSNTANFGGALYNVFARVTSNTITGNVAEMDGGAFCMGGISVLNVEYGAVDYDQTVDNNLIEGNTAGRYGGAFSRVGGMQIFDNRILRNQAAYGGAFAGGDRICEPHPINTDGANTPTEFHLGSPCMDTWIYENKIAENHATVNGGAFYELCADHHRDCLRHFDPIDGDCLPEVPDQWNWLNSEPWIEDNWITSNTAAQYGGAFYNCSGVIWQVESDPCTADWRKPRIHRNYIIGNEARFGGAVYDGDILDMINCVIAHNKAEVGSGLMEVGQKAFLDMICDRDIYTITSVFYCTIYENDMLPEYGGAGVRGGGANYVNCIIWGNMAALDPDVAHAQFYDSTPAPLYSCIEGWSGGREGNIATEPSLVNPDSMNYAQRPESYTIDSGSYDGAYIPEGVSRFGRWVEEDILGNARPFVDGTDSEIPRGDGSDADMGAYEFIKEDPTIAGTVRDFLGNPVAGVTLTANGNGFNGTALSDSLGSYTLQVPFEWTGRITPSSPNYTFLPAQRNYVEMDNEQAWYVPENSFAHYLPFQDYTAAGTEGPDNDDFIDAFTLSGSEGSAQGHNVNATKQTGEPLHNGLEGGVSVWWKWTPEQNGTVTVDTSGSTFNTVLAVYTGFAVDSLTEVTSNDNANDTNKSEVNFRARAGVTYYLAVDGPWDKSWGGITLNWMLHPAPDNDHFADAIILSGDLGSISGNNSTGSHETGEPIATGTAGAEASIWYKWTAPAEGFVRFNTARSSIDTVLAVYTGFSVSGLTEVAANNNAEEGVTYSALSFETAANTTYYIQVDGLTSADEGGIVLSWDYYARPGNDTFAQAVVLSGAAGSVNGWNVGASHEAGENDHAGKMGTASVWFQWTPSFTGNVEWQTSLTDYDPVIALYTGNAVNALTMVASNDNAGTNESNSFLMVPVLQGTTYYIAVDSARADGWGNFRLHWQLTAPPPNDDFVDGAIISNAEGSVGGWNVGATRETDEPDHFGAHNARSVWYSWTAPATMGVSFDTRDSNFDTVLAVYTGDSVANLTRVAQNDDAEESGLSDRWSRVLFNAVQGYTYRIAVDGYHGNDTGDFTLAWNMVEMANNDYFGEAEALEGQSGSWAGSNVGFSAEADEPFHGGASGRQSAWFRYTPPLSARTIFSTGGSSFDNVLALYVGESLDALTFVAGNRDETGGGEARLDLKMEAGETYYLAVDGWTLADMGVISLSWRQTLQPANDHFQDAKDLGTLNEGVAMHNVDVVNTKHATREVGEPFHANGYGDHSVWYTWTAQQTGRVRFSTEGSSFDTTLEAYAGESLGGLQPLARNNNEPGSGKSWSWLDFTVSTGETYYLAADGWREDDAGTLTLSLAFYPPPTNDAFANATHLVGYSGIEEGYTVNASHETGEGQHAGVSGDNSIWWRYTPDADGYMTLSTQGSNFDTALAVYTGSAVNALTAMVWNDDASDGDTHLGYWSETALAVQKGTVYYIVVDGATPDSKGDVTLDWAFYGPPDNDNFSAAEAIGADSGSREASLMTATVEAGEPVHGIGRTLWWRYTASFTGKVQFNTEGSQVNSVLVAYTGDSLGGLTQLALDRGVSAEGASIGFAVTAGQSYVIQLDGRGESDVGVARLNWQLQQAPANDQPEDAYAISGSQGSVTGTNEMATRNSGDSGEGPSVWWRWTAPLAGTVDIDTFGSSFDTVLSVYTGTAPDGLELYVQNDNAQDTPQSAVQFGVAAGEVYYIEVAGASPEEEGDIRLNWQVEAAPSNDFFRYAAVLTGQNGRINGSTEKATMESGEPLHAGGRGTRSIWYRWTAPHNGEVAFQTQGSDFDTVLAVYTGDQVNNLTELRANDDAEVPEGFASWSYVSFLPVPGETYYIAVSSFFPQDYGAVLLSWAQSAAAPAMWTTDFGAFGPWSDPQYLRMLEDVNGDGLDDVVGFGDSGVVVALSEGNGFGPTRQWITDFGWLRTAGEWSTEKHLRLMGDFDGDGRADIVGFGEKNTRVSLSNGTDFAPSRNWMDNMAWAQGWRNDQHKRCLADVDGDGLEDVVGFGNPGVFVAINQQFEFAKPTMWAGDFGVNQGWDLSRHPRFTPDLNGDGRADVAGFGDKGIMAARSEGIRFEIPTRWTGNFGLSRGWTSEKHIRLFSDVNGDGRDDAVGFGNQAVYVALSTGSSFGETSAWVYDMAFSNGWTVEKHPRTSVDMDGDGKMDLAGFGGPGVWVALSSGDGFTQPMLWVEQFGADQFWSTELNPRYFGEVDGDGIPDIVGFAHNGVIVY